MQDVAKLELQLEEAKAGALLPFANVPPLEWL